MKSSSTIPIESPFTFRELFFSRTNKKGIIESGNSVFQRISLYDWDEMLGKPHNIIRHPEMPRGVFHLLWETILSDETIGAYVVNRAKDGSYYWVYALVFPIENGFLSVRLKPGSELLQVVKNKYSQLLSLEKSQGLKPVDSQAVLLQTIRELGFLNYRDFMSEALMSELEERQRQLQEPPVPILSLLRILLDCGNRLKKRCDDIFAAYQANSRVPLNLEIQAARIGEKAAPIAIMSARYDAIAKDIKKEVNKLVEAQQRVQQKVRSCQFFICSSILQKEIHHFFKSESQPMPISKETEMEILGSLELLQVKEARESLNDVKSELETFNLVFEEVRKLVVGLDMLSLSGRIEVAKLDGTSSELFGLLEDLTKFKNFLKTALSEIDDIGNSLLEQAAAIFNVDDFFAAPGEH